MFQWVVVEFAPYPSYKGKWIKPVRALFGSCGAAPLNGRHSVSQVQCLNGRQGTMALAKRCWPDTMWAIRNFSRTPLPFTVQRPRPASSYRVRKCQSSLQSAMSTLNGQQDLVPVDLLRSVAASIRGEAWWETIAQITSASPSNDLRPAVLFVLFNIFLCGIVYRHCRKSRPLKGLVNEKVEVSSCPTSSVERWSEGLKAL